MLTVLLKKQLLSTFMGTVRRSSIGKKKGKAGIILYLLLMVYLLAIFGLLFFSLMGALCEPLHQIGMDWLYFVYAAIMATVLGIFGTVFMAQSQLYDAKDNEMLLSLPIPPGYILFCRMVPIYGQMLLFEALALVPCFLVYGMVVGVTAGSTVAWILMTLLIPLFGMVLTCLLGWLVAKLVSRMRNKTAFSLILSLAFLGGYYFVYFQFNKYLSLLLANSAAIGSAIAKNGKLLVLLGEACQGKFGALAIIAALILVLFGAMYLILSETYLGILTANQTVAKAKYKEKAVQSRSSSSALLQKEWRRFFSSATYMLNAGLGVLILLVGTVAAVIKGDMLISTLEQVMPGMVAQLPVMLTAFITFVSVTNLVSAPSISLEGNTLWVLQSLPVDPKQILQAKLKLHILVSAPMSVISAVVLSLVFHVAPAMAVFMVITPVAAIAFFGCFGLVMNLWKPRLDWDHEAMVVKQSASVTITLFGNWGILAALIVIYLWIGSEISPVLYLSACTGLFAIGFAALYSWMMKKGAKIFANL